MHDQPSNGTETQIARVDATPPHLSQVYTQVVDDHRSIQEARRSTKKVYDIPTLLRLKETQSAVPVMLRVKPEAIKGKSLTLQPPRSSSNELMP